MKTIGLLGLLLFVFSCQAPDGIETKWNHPVCIDSIDFVPKILTYEDLEENLRYNLLYIGEEKDTIRIDYKLSLNVIISPPPPPPPPSKDFKRAILQDTVIDKVSEEWEKGRNKLAAYWCYIEDFHGNYKHVIMDSAKVEITVDTNHYLLSFDGIPIPDRSFKAHPVIIKNIENDTLIIASRDYIKLSLEGETQEGWQTLVNPRQHRGCGNGMTYLLLPPNEILVTSIPIYKWKETTQLRLKLGNNYSSTFIGKTTVQ